MTLAKLSMKYPIEATTNSAPSTRGMSDLTISGSQVSSDAQSTDYAGTSAQHRAELEAIIESIRIEP